MEKCLRGSLTQSLFKVFLTFSGGIEMAHWREKG